MIFPLLVRLYWSTPSKPFSAAWSLIVLIACFQSQFCFFCSGVCQFDFNCIIGHINNSSLLIYQTMSSSFEDDNVISCCFLILILTYRSCARIQIALSSANLISRLCKYYFPQLSTTLPSSISKPLLSIKPFLMKQPLSSLICCKLQVNIVVVFVSSMYVIFHRNRRIKSLH